MFSLICTWINGWVNTRDAGDLRRHRAHYDVIVMLQGCNTCTGVVLKYMGTSNTKPPKNAAQCELCAYLSGLSSTWVHYSDVIMGAVTSQITSLTIVCLLTRLFRRRSKKTSKLRVTGLCAGNSPVTGEFPAQRASNAENVSIWWRHHEVRQNANCVHIFAEAEQYMSWSTVFHCNSLNGFFVKCHWTCWPMHDQSPMIDHMIEPVVRYWI